MNDGKTRIYLDIETDGLSPSDCQLTVVGVYIVRPDGDDFKCFCGEQFDRGALLDLVQQADYIYTYNGHRFDLPFIKARTGLALDRVTRHIDLMYHCWRHNLRGGLKAVERRLGIVRQLPDIDGYKAVLLWKRYKHYGDQDSFDTLLAYNKEDCVNLHILRQKLGVD